MTIEFNSYLKDEDWVAAMGGWRCEALRIPGAKFKALYHDGEKAVQESYEIENHIIRWLKGAKPKDLLVTLSLAENLPTQVNLEEEKLRLDQERLNLEREKASVETKWKVATAIGAVLGGLFTFGTTYFLKPSIQTNAVAVPPRVHTYAGAMTKPEATCVSSLAKSLENYGLQNVTPVQRGVYATKEKYNIFVGCNADVKATFLVVSGPEDSEAKRIREDVKSLLP
jgi:hypothetical protein